MRSSRNSPRRSGPPIPAAALIGTMPMKRFNRTRREKVFAKFDRAFSPGMLKRLFSIGRLDALVSENRIGVHQIDILSRNWSRTLDDDQGRTGRPNNRLLTERFAAGATIRVRDLQWVDPAISMFCEAVQRSFLARAQINAYLTPPQAEGIAPHFDPHDVFIVQCEGQKQWTLHKDYTNRVELPLGNARFNSSHRPTGDFEQLLLRQGDTLYIPRGVMHEASCQDRESLHLTVSLSPLTTADLLLEAIARHGRTEISLRAGCFFVEGATERGRTAAEKAIRDRLGEIVNRLDIRAVIDDFLDEVLASAKESAPGNFASLVSLKRPGSANDASVPRATKRKRPHTAARLNRTSG